MTTKNAYLADVLAQPRALRLVLEHLLGPGQESVERAAAEIRSARRVVLTSMGSAYYALAPAKLDLDDGMHPATLLETAEVLAHPPGPEDAIVVASRSGESREVATLARQPRSGTRLVALTMTPSSTLTSGADVVVHDVSPFDDLVCVKAHTTLSLTALLIAATVREERQQTVQGLYALIDWLDSTMPSLLQTTANATAVDHGLTFLGEGTARATTGAATLWYEEVARLRASASTLSAFDHGPIEQVEPGVGLVLVDLDDAQRGLDYAAKLRTLGASPFTVVSSDVDLPADVVIPTCGLRPAARTLAAAVPMQMLAFHAAVGRGIEPGTMRHTGWVVG